MPSSPRPRVRTLVDGRAFQLFVLLLIVVNTLAVGLNTFPAVTSNLGTLLHSVSRITLAVFVIELSLRLYGHGPRFFRDGWNVFDLLVVGLALVPALGALSVLRALRGLRVLRLASLFPSARHVATGLLAALPRLGAVIVVAVLLAVVMTVSSVGLFGTARPAEFGDFGAAAGFLVSLLGGDGWAVVADLMTSSPAAWIFFGAMPVVGLTMVGLVIAVIVAAFQEDNRVDVNERLQQEMADQARYEALILEEVRALRREVSELRQRSADREGR